VPQEGSVFPGLSVREHIDIALAGRGVAAGVDAVAELFPVLGERLDQHAQTLSGGERKMLGIAQALVGEPKVILMDEPTEGVAPVVVQQLIPAIGRIRERTAVVLVEQNIDTALSLGRSAIVLEHGGVVEEGNVAALHDAGVLERRLSL
jgi:branched-chain amino acid transport system ATP-binding protein